MAFFTGYREHFEACAQHNANLFSIENEAELNFVISKLFSTVLRQH